MRSAVSGYARTAASARLLAVSPQRLWSLGAGVCPAPIEPQPGGHRGTSVEGAPVNGTATGFGGLATAVERTHRHLSARQFEKCPPGFPDLSQPA
jgi:hypothetical protein